MKRFGSSPGHGERRTNMALGIWDNAIRLGRDGLVRGCGWLDKWMWTGWHLGVGGGAFGMGWELTSSRFGICSHHFNAMEVDLFGGNIVDGVIWIQQTTFRGILINVVLVWIKEKCRLSSQKLLWACSIGVSRGWYVIFFLCLEALV